MENHRSHRSVDSSYAKRGSSKNIPGITQKGMICWQGVTAGNWIGIGSILQYGMKQNHQYDVTIVGLPIITFECGIIAFHDPPNPTAAGTDMIELSIIVCVST